MRIIVNDKDMEFPENGTVSELLIRLSAPPEKTLVSVNGETLAVDEFHSKRLNDEDFVELFTFVPGG